MLIVLNLCNVVSNFCVSSLFISALVQGNAARFAILHQKTQFIEKFVLISFI